MYVLELLNAGHRDLIEQEHFLSQLLSPASDERTFINGMNKFSAFLEVEVRQHMDIEEKVLYPVMMRVLPIDKGRIVKELEADHRIVLEKVAQFHDMVSGLGASCDREKRKCLLDLFREILRLTVPHMRREFEIIPPLINAFFKSAHYMEVEERFVRFKNAKL